MSHSSSHPSLEGHAFVAAVDELMQRHQLDPVTVELVQPSPRRRPRWRRGHAVAENSGAWAERLPHARVVVSAGVLARSPELLRWTAAHEVAHLAQPLHQTRRRERATQALLAAMMLFGAGLIAASGYSMLTDTRQSAAVVVVAFAAGVIGALGSLVGVFAVCRQEERAADALAANWGFPVTPTVVAMLEDQEGRNLSPRWPTWLRTHPKPRDRAAHTARSDAAGDRR